MADGDSGTVVEPRTSGRKREQPDSPTGAHGSSRPLESGADERASGGPSKRMRLWEGGPSAQARALAARESAQSVVSPLDFYLEESPSEVVLGPAPATDALLRAAERLYYGGADGKGPPGGKDPSSDPWAAIDAFPGAVTPRRLLLSRDPFKPPSWLETWNPREISSFEAGVCSYRKDFNDIQKVVKTKSVNELVDCFYTWKAGSHYLFWKRCKKRSSRFMGAERVAALEEKMEGFDRSAAAVEGDGGGAKNGRTAAPTNKGEASSSSS